jgi:hypothetical protein
VKPEVDGTTQASGIAHDLNKSLALEAARERSPGACFVLVTGWGAAIDPAQARFRGVDEVLAKPYHIAELRLVAKRVAAGPNNV